MLVAATPFAIVEFFKTGEIYILSRRFVDDVVARFHGPGRLRFIIQPVTAIILGVRDGVTDSDDSRPPFLLGLLFHRSYRGDLLRSAIATMRNLIAVAILADVVAQFLILGKVNPFAALLLGPLLVGLPYGSSRLLTNQLARWRQE